MRAKQKAPAPDRDADILPPERPPAPSVDRRQGQRVPKSHIN